MAAAISTIFDSLRDLSDSPVFYLVIFVIAVLDSVFPVVPSETMVIIGGVAAGLGDLNILAVMAVGAAGAFVGDNMSFEIGLRAKDPVTRWYSRSEKRLKRLEWADRQIEERGGLLLITARFIPGGRTLLTLSCGITGQPHRWFAKWVGAAAVIWASYAALLGYAGGKTFEDNHTLAFVVAFTTAISITVLIEVIRHVRKRKS
ncbi:MAG: DedA family protein [Actinobacteria bacterium]|nr:DedA family protein [Actinomycetota bacterium]NBP53682.1 DedA family protein [Actinomycetota bacterium]